MTTGTGRFVCWKLYSGDQCYGTVDIKPPSAMPVSLRVPIAFQMLYFQSSSAKGWEKQ